VNSGIERRSSEEAGRLGGSFEIWAVTGAPWGRVPRVFLRSKVKVSEGSNFGGERLLGAANGDEPRRGIHGIKKRFPNSTCVGIVAARFGEEIQAHGCGVVFFLARKGRCARGDNTNRRGGRGSYRFCGRFFFTLPSLSDYCLPTFLPFVVGRE